MVTGASPIIRGPITIARACLPVSKHPEPEIPYVGLGEHVEQVCRVGEMHIVVRASVREQVIDLLEGCHVGDRRVDVSAGIQVGKTHIPLGVYRICRHRA